MAGILKGNLDVTKIPKDKIYNGKKGKYIPVVIAINNEVDQFGHNGSVTVDQSKEERDAKEPKVYLGNIKVVWTDGEAMPAAQQQGQAQPAAPATAAPADDDLPF
tara:strand:- start:355 stop:669 length:315 start_codon:yes stop_codon:yes gene_type:complete